MSADRIVQELLARGVPPEEIERVNPTLGQRARTGLVAPRLVAPDKIAERGAYIRDYSKLSERREGLGRYYPVKSKLDKFDALNRQAGTGKIYAMETLNPIAGIAKAFNPALEEMSGIASELQGQARPVGSGATSDFEQRLYRMGVPSPDKSGPTNASITAYMRGVLDEESDRTAFDEEFLRRNGSLAGSQEAWSRYVNANPYTVAGKGGRSSLNPNRKDWRGHFGLTPGAPKPSITTNAPRKGAADPFPGIRDGQFVVQGGVRYQRKGNQMVEAR